MAVIVVLLASAVGSVWLHDGPDLVNFSLLAIAAMPWIFWIARRRLPAPGPAAVWVLGPAVVAGVIAQAARAAPGAGAARVATSSFSSVTFPGCGP